MTVGGPALHLPPLLSTDRLTLRPWGPGDGAELWAALGESVDDLLPWVPWATPEPPTRDQAEALLARWQAERAAGANFIYAIFDREHGRLVGGIGLYARVGAGRLEVGYWIRSTASGNGFATEAARALTELGLSLEGVHAIEMHIDPANVPSQRVPEKLGYRRGDSGATSGASGSGARHTIVYERIRPA